MICGCCWLEGASTVYFSASNYFTQYNYSAIPINSNQNVSDKYRLRYLLSTADIKKLKESDEVFDPKHAALFGGVKYDLDTADIIAEAMLYNDSGNDEDWNMTRGLPEDLRSGFRYLNGTLDEVDNIADVLRMD